MAFDLTTALRDFLQNLIEGTVSGSADGVTVRFADGTAAAPSVSFTSDPNTGWYWNGSGAAVFTSNGTISHQLNETQHNLYSDAAMITMGQASDLQLHRDAANTVAQRNGTAAQTLRWYHTFTDASNRQNGALLTDAAYVGLSAETAGTGADNVGVRLAPAGTGTVLATTAITPVFVATAIGTAGAVTYAAAEVKGGIILRDCNGAARADLVPTAAALLAAIPGAAVGQGFEFTIRNTSGTAVAITVTTNTGVTLSGTMTIAQNNTKRFLIVFTNVTAAAEAYTLYSLGTVVH